MDLKKVFDQTVRELKREVNKKVLKVPEIEVKILEATSNEPWGPHGTIMGDIAQATRNHNDYQMIMTVLYKRLNDTGRNWRHVYKALTVLEYLVANGSERVIDELQEHTYQIQTLCEFQYLEQSGKDQGINVRKKAQTLVALIKDKDKIREVRSKAAANRDKYRGVSSTGMTHRSSSYSSTGGGYGDRDDDRYGGSRGGRDEYDYSGRGGGRDADRYRDDDPYGGGRERSRNSSYDGRDASKERDAYGSKGNDSYPSKGGDRDGYASKGGDRYEKYESGSVSDRDRDRGYDDDDSYSSRNGKSKGGSTPPPAYEEAVQRPAADEDSNDSRRVAAPVAKTQTSKVEAPVSAAPETVSQPSAGGSYVASQTADDGFDDFDPRGSGFSASASAPSQPTENFFPESTTNLFPEPAPAPIAQAPPPPPPPAVQKSLGGLEDLFGDSFIPAPAPVSAPAPAPAFAPAAASTPANNLSNHQVQTNDLFGDSFSATPSTASDGFEVSAFQATPGPSPFQTASSTAPAASDPFGSSSFHLAPPPPPPVAYQPPTAPPSNFGGNSMHGFGAPGVSNGTGTNGTTFGQSPTPFDTAAHNTGFSQASGLGYGNNQGFPRQQSFSGMPQASSANQSPYGVQQNMGGLHRSASAPHELHQPQPQPPRPQQPARKEFGPVKSAIWGDTLSMGLVDLNIAGPKVNPLNDLGIQLTDPTLKNELWGADNPKQAQKKPTSSSGMGQPMGAAMGKAMGSGSGLGRAGASGLPPPMPAPSTMGPGMGVGMRPQMVGGMNFNMGMGLNPNMGISPGMGMGMGVGMGPQMGIGMNQMGQNFQMGMGGYPNQQQQFGYR
ncbi:uncharacterized protein [Physcomitrium patens]|uniref:ENTH domain-containing protein n=1 Tax=Physcomitrium patens TaxID=3218 RepID=A0A2K1IW26_PHYPA|nr:clathrin interactor EPSIN 2-like isoform X2 [Physcomitrium patens]PNR33481.1 hypothetical protein PHYPA_025425 [Physcomitrium patens]|eukprot:XP_024357809.1 clathrin interactor EPSIN 2-like isoform X2 [Physcomitrella patens]